MPFIKYREKILRNFLKFWYSMFMYLWKCTFYCMMKQGCPIWVQSGSPSQICPICGQSWATLSSNLPPLWLRCVVCRCDSSLLSKSVSTSSLSQPPVFEDMNLPMEESRDAMYNAQQHGSQGSMYNGGQSDMGGPRGATGIHMLL